MATFKVNKTKDYTIMSNTHLREKDMSLKAKGLLSIMLSLPKDWDYSISGLVAICKENETAITSTLTELKRFGYVIVNKIYPNKDNGGRIDYEYNIYEKPQKQKGGEQDLENLPLECQGIENQGQLNTNKQSTYKSKTYYTQKEKIESESIDTDILSYQEVLAIAKEECPTVYDRYMNKYPMGSSVVFDKVTKMLDELSNSYSYEKLRELFRKANRMYIIKPAFTKLDFVWVLNNLREIEQATIEEQANREENDLPPCTVHKVNGAWKF